MFETMVSEFNKSVSSKLLNPCSEDDVIDTVLKKVMRSSLARDHTNENPSATVHISPHTEQVLTSRSSH